MNYQVGFQVRSKSKPDAPTLSTHHAVWTSGKRGESVTLKKESVFKTLKGHRWSVFVLVDGRTKSKEEKKIYVGWNPVGFTLLPSSPHLTHCYSKKVGWVPIYQY